MHSRRSAHKQGSNQPRAGFYFIHERPELLTGPHVVRMLAHYLPRIREAEPDRFTSHLAFIQEDGIPEAMRVIPRHNYGVRGLVRYVSIGTSRQALQDKLAHLHLPTGTRSARAPRYHTQEHCVIYVGDFPFHMVNARYNLEETGVLKEKWMDFCEAASMLVPHSTRPTEPLLRLQDKSPCVVWVNCYEPEKFNSDSFDHFAELVGLRKHSDRLSPARAARILGLSPELVREDEDLDPVEENR